MYTNTHTHTHRLTTHTHKNIQLVLKWDRSGLNIFKNFEFMFVQFVLPKSTKRTWNVDPCKEQSSWPGEYTTDKPDRGCGVTGGKARQTLKEGHRR